MVEYRPDFSIREQLKRLYISEERKIHTLLPLRVSYIPHSAPPVSVPLSPGPSLSPFSCAFPIHIPSPLPPIPHSPLDASFLPFASRDKQQLVLARKCEREIYKASCRLLDVVAQIDRH